MTDFDPLLARRLLPPPTVAAAQTNPEPTGPTRTAVNPTVRRRRRHPAKGARITAAGLGVTTMLGLVATMGVARALSNETVTDTPPATTPVGTPATASVPAPATTAPAPVTTAPITEPATTAPATAVPAPVTLTARPEVRVISPPAAQAPAAAPAPPPAATTRGSN